MVVWCSLVSQPLLPGLEAEAVAMPGVTFWYESKIKGKIHRKYNGIRNHMWC